MPGLTRRQLLSSSAVVPTVLRDTEAPSPNPYEVVWRERLTDEGRYRSSAVTADENILVLADDGQNDSATTIVQIGTDGDPRQVWPRNEPVEKEYDAIRATGEGNVYLAGSGQEANSSELTVLNEEWEPEWNLSVGMDAGRHILASPTRDQIILAGTTELTSGFHTDVVGINTATRSVTWQVAAFSNGYLADTMVPYRDGCILGGRSVIDQEAGWIARISPTGEILWKNTYDNSEVAGVSSVAVDANDRIVLAGSQSGAKTNRVLTLNADGETVWSLTAKIGPKPVAIVPVGTEKYLLAFQDWDYPSSETPITLAAVEENRMQSFGLELHGEPVDVVDMFEIEGGLMLVGEVISEDRKTQSPLILYVTHQSRTTPHVSDIPDTDTETDKDITVTTSRQTTTKGAETTDGTGEGAGIVSVFLGGVGLFLWRISQRKDG